MLIFGFVGNFCVDWLISHVNIMEESVYLVNPGTGALRKISVPGAESARIKDGKLIIYAGIGYFWQVDPNNGFRRRLKDN